MTPEHYAARAAAVRSDNARQACACGCSVHRPCGAIVVPELAVGLCAGRAPWSTSCLRLPAVLEALRARGPSTPKEMREAMPEMSRANVNSALVMLVKKGQAENDAVTYTASPAAESGGGIAPKIARGRGRPPKVRAPELLEEPAFDPVIAPMLERRGRLVRELAGIDAAIAAYRAAMGA